MNVLHGYSDASGKAEHLPERMLVVAGALSTPDRWDAWAKDWDAFLLSEGFEPDQTHGRCIFHTSSFFSGGYKGMPQRLTKDDKDRIYFKLAEITKKYALYRFGYGLIVEDYRRLVQEFNGAERLLGIAGYYLTTNAVVANSAWAVKNGYKQSIGYTLDRGDSHGSRFENNWRKVRKDFEDYEITVASVTIGSSAEYPAIQAADMIAWAMRNWCITMPHKKLARAQNPSHKLRVLMCPNKRSSRFEYEGYEDMRTKLFDKTLEVAHRSGRDFIGAIKTKAEIEPYVRSILNEAMQEIAEAKKAKYKEWKDRKKKK